MALLNRRAFSWYPWMAPVSGRHWAGGEPPDQKVLLRRSCSACSEKGIMARRSLPDLDSQCVRSTAAVRDVVGNMTCAQRYEQGIIEDKLPISSWHERYALHYTHSVMTTRAAKPKTRRNSAAAPPMQASSNGECAGECGAGGASRRRGLVWDTCTGIFRAAARDSRAHMRRGSADEPFRMRGVREIRSRDTHSASYHPPGQILWVTKMLTNAQIMTLKYFSLTHESYMLGNLTSSAIHSQKT